MIMALLLIPIQWIFTFIFPGCSAYELFSSTMFDLRFNHDNKKLRKGMLEASLKGIDKLHSDSR